MKLLKRRVAIRICSIICIIVLIGAVWVKNERDYINTRVTRLGFINSAISSQIENKIRNELYIVEIFRVLINTNEKETLSKFYRIADKFYTDQMELDSIRLAPQGVVEYIYPEINSKEYKLNLFEDEERRRDALKAKTLGKTLISGPMKLEKGDLGIVTRAPIYDNDTGEFWGFSIATLSIDELMESLESFESTADVYYCKLWMEKDGKQKIIWTNSTSDDQMRKTTQKKIDLIDGTVWYMEMTPKGGWLGSEKLVRDILFALFNMFLLIGVALYFIKTIENNMYLNRMVERDALTKLLNKRALLDVIKTLDTEKSSYGVMYIDIDKFKEINDTYGHNVGDCVLKEVSARLKGSLRQGDYVYRYGGDEFVIILSGNISSEIITGVRERIRENVNKKIEIGEISLIPHISIGFAKSSEFKDSDAEDVINLADKRMYMDKTSNYKKYNKCEDEL